MGDELNSAFVARERRGSALGAQMFLERVEAQLNDEIPSPLASPQARPGPWDRVSGPVVALAAAALVSLVVVGGAWLIRGIDSTEAVTAPVPTTVLPQAVEAPWVEEGELRVESTIITQRSLSAQDGLAVLEYALTPLGPTVALSDDDTPVPAVLPELWEIETVHGTAQGTSSPTGHSVRFEIDDAVTLGDITAIRLLSWRTAAPVTYDFTINADAGTAIRMPDGSTIVVSRVIDVEEGVVVGFDATLPPEHWSAVPCGDGMIGASCFEPIPGSGWTPRQSDSDLQIMAESEASLSSVGLRYRRPMWIRTEGSLELPLSAPSTPGAEATAFPDGYVAVSDTVAVKPTRITSYGDQVLVSMTSVVRRGIDRNAVEPFMGGRWVLETASGVTIESIGTAFKDDVGGAFTAVFPVNGSDDIVPIRLRLVETWHPGSRSGVGDAGSVESLMDGTDVPIDIVLDSATTIRIERFDVEGVGGYGVWSVAGADMHPIVADVTGAFIDSEGAAVAQTETWGPPPRHFGMSNTGRLFWFWAVGNLPDEELDERLANGGHRLEIRVAAEVPEPAPADIVLELSEVPVE